MSTPAPPIRVARALTGRMSTGGITKPRLLPAPSRGLTTVSAVGRLPVAAVAYVHGVAGVASGCSVTGGHRAPAAGRCVGPLRPRRGGTGGARLRMASAVACTKLVRPPGARTDVRAPQAGGLRWGALVAAQPVREMPSGGPPMASARSAPAVRASEAPTRRPNAPGAVRARAGGPAAAAPSRSTLTAGRPAAAGLVEGRRAGRRPAGAAPRAGSPSSRPGALGSSQAGSPVRGEDPNARM